MEQQPIPSVAETVSAILTRARRDASALGGPPDALPEDLDTAYAIQRLSIDAWPDDVAGWKVGGVPPDYKDRFGEERLAGPIFARSIVSADPGETARMPVFEHGFAAIEPELVLRLGADRASDRMFIGAEIASSPIPAINDYGPVAVISDFGNNNGLLLGPEIEDWQNHSGPVDVAAEIDGKQVGSRRLETLQGDATAALEFLLDLAERKGFALPEGVLVSTGAITGVHEAEIGAQSRLDFGPFGELRLELVKAAPRA